MAARPREVVQVPMTPMQVVFTNQALNFLIAGLTGDMMGQIQVIQAASKHLRSFMTQEEVDELVQVTIKLAKAAIPDAEVNTLK